jgi:hypothetical protein
MNWVEATRGNSPVTRVRTKSLSMPVVSDPPVELSFVREADGPAVDVLGDPAVCVAIEAIAKPTNGVQGVAARQPNDLRVGVGHHRFDCFPDRGGDRAGLVEDHKNSAANNCKAARKPAAAP